MNKFYSFVFLSTLSVFVYAQNNQRFFEFSKTIEQVDNKAVYISLKEGYTVYESNAEAFLNNVIFTDENIKVKVFKSERDEIGYSHTRYALLYKNVVIENAQVIVHASGGKIISLNGDLEIKTNPVNTVFISKEQAFQKALDKVNAQKYKWENREEEQHMKDALNDQSFSYYPKSELVLFSDNKPQKDKKYAYAYRFDIYAEAPLYKANVFVDAKSGKILAEQSLLCNADVTATAVTKYSGNKTMTTDNFGTNLYRMRETGRGNGVETYDLNNGTSYGAAVDFTNSTTSWTTTGVDQGATDAHWGAEMTYDYLWFAHNRNSIDNAGFKLLSYVHYSNSYNNAFWDGTRMTYGDGNGSTFTILTALDVCGHEVAHGLTSNTSNLIYSYESGALNESNSDIFGTLIENYGRPTQWDWKIGQDMTPSGNGIRNMSNPKLHNHPNTYLGQYWYTGSGDNGGVHYNSGVNNYWFYLLSIGATGTNDNSNTYTVTGIGMANAAKIQYRALTYYYVPSTNYANARILSIQAAKDLFGNCSNEVVQTTNAWYAVGVGGLYTNTVVPNFTTMATSICSASSPILFKNTSVNGLSYFWDFGDGNTSTVQHPVHTYTSNGSYSVKLKTVGCLSLTDSTTKANYVTVSAPSSPVTTGASACGPTTVNLSATGGANLNWYSTPSATGTPVFNGNNYNTPILSSNTNYYVVNSVANTPVFGAPSGTNIGTAGNHTTNLEYLIFDVYQPCTLKTVVVYATGAGNRTFELRNSGGAVITNTIINCISGMNTVTLNFSLNPGTAYQLGLSSTSASNLIRNRTGSAYPYNIGNMVNITGNSYAQTYYFYFYNWQVVKDDCKSQPSIVTASITPTPTLAVNSGVVCSGKPSTLTVSGAGTYSWSTGATGSSIVVTPTVNTTYTVTGTNGGMCSKTATTNVTIHPSPVVSASAQSNTVCTFDAPVNLTGSPAGGTFMGFGVVGNTFNPTITGQGTFQVSYYYTNANGCSGSSHFNMTVNICSDVQVASIDGGKVNMALYPNPANDYFIVTKNTKDVLTIKVIDNNGKLIIEKQLFDVKERIDISKLAKAVYHIEISDGKLAVYKTSIVKQ